MRLILLIFKELYWRFLLICLGVILAFGIIEILLCVSAAAFGHARVERENQFARSHGSVRILALGESTTEGVGSGESWPQQLERILEARYPEKTFQVYNRGRAGITSADIATSLPDWLIKDNPHIVIGMIGVNDYGNALVFEAHEFLPGLIARSRTYQFLRGFYRLLSSDYTDSRDPVSSMSAASSKGWFGIGIAYAQSISFENGAEERCRAAAQLVNQGAKPTSLYEESNNDRFKELETIAKLCLDLNHKETAVFIFESLLASQPSEKLYADIALMINFTMGNFERAKKFIERGMQIFPDSPILHSAHARVLIFPKGQRSEMYSDDAEKSARRAVAVAPDHLSYYEDLSQVVNGSGPRCSKHTALFESLPARFNGTGTAWKVLADFYEGCFMEKKMELALAKAASAPDCEISCALRYGRYLESKGRLHEARDIFKRGLGLYPQSHVFYEHLAAVHLQLAEFEEALKLYQKAIEGGLMESSNIFDRDGASVRQRAIVRLINRSNFIDNRTMKSFFAWLGDEAPTKNATTFFYRRIRDLVHGHGARLIAMQYPTLPLDSLHKIFEADPDVLLVDNYQNFKEALSRHSYEELFVDRIAPTFGHSTDLGSRLIAESAADAVQSLLSREVMLAD